MKRIPLAQLKKILRVGDYVGSNKGEIHLVTHVDKHSFTFGNLDHKRYWTGKLEYQGKLIDTWKTWYWLPGDLLESTDTISKIKAARLKEHKEHKQCTQTSATTTY